MFPFRVRYSLIGYVNSDRSIPDLIWLNFTFWTYPRKNSEVFNEEHKINDKANG